MRPYLALTKPRITWLILISTAIGYYFGLQTGGAWVPWRLFHTLLGTALLASGTAALNQWWEREPDARMRRTAGRPIPSGAIRARSALLFGIAISCIGFLELAVLVNLTSALLGLATLVAYLFLYTPLKRRSWLSTTVGAFPGAMPPVIGFAAAGGLSFLPALVLFAILFFWQFPHFYAIAWMYREDYARAGIRMLPVVEPDCRSTARQMLIAGAVLLVVSVLPSVVGMSGRVYELGAVVLGAWLLYAVVCAISEQTRTRARGVLIASVIYLPLLFGLLVIDRR